MERQVVPGSTYIADGLLHYSTYGPMLKLTLPPQQDVQLTVYSHNYNVMNYYDENGNRDYTREKTFM
ncbi:hypothetical protein [Yaravirus sp. 'brasiliensis']|uniref:Uncharacterized protein n=1 Tax=Yaravirus sp. 'brasiliensis' TaxID=2739681 RepID=A0AAE7B7P5_9VIRU|nr:hypothetical protein QKS73_gp13 [Yaravirus brasiliensis]QKE44386.1 hypothetical protein [Yaravirus brasiliensis]